MFFLQEVVTVIMPGETSSGNFLQVDTKRLYL